MRTLLGRLTSLLLTTRWGLALAATANIWFVLFWTRAHPQHEPGSASLAAHDLWILLAGGLGCGVGLTLFGVLLNDLLDLRQDRARRPMRTLPSGRLGHDAALVLAVAGLLLAVLGATLISTHAVLITLALALVILAFNGLGKFVPGLGLTMLGLLYIGHMLIPNWRLVFLWPVWLAMTSALVVATLEHSIADRIPRVSARAIAAAVLGWIGWSALIAALAVERAGDGPVPGWPAWIPLHAALPPLIVTLALALVATRTRRLWGRGERTARRIGHLSSIGMALSGAAWLGAVGLFVEAALSAALVGGTLGLVAAARELNALAAPADYRLDEPLIAARGSGPARPDSPGRAAS